MGNKNSKPKSKANDFIIKHFQQNKENDGQHGILSTYDERRIVFINLNGLCQSWKRVPSVSLYTALIMLPMKKRWIYHPTEYTQIFAHIAQFTEITEFIELIRWKDSQGLVVWIADYFDDHHPIFIGNIDAEQNGNSSIYYDPLIAKFWYCFNDKLSSLYDHITGTEYKPINLDLKWWRNKAKFISKYDVKPSAILNAFYFLNIEYDTIREIIYQSNPKSLHPVIVYQSNTKIVCPSEANQHPLQYVLSRLSPIKEPLSPIISSDDIDAKYSWSCIQEHNLQGINKNNNC